MGGYLAPGEAVRVGTGGSPGDDSPTGVIVDYDFTCQSYKVRMDNSGGVLSRKRSELDRI